MENSGNEFDVIVVGAGIMGSCAAYQTAKRGHKTLLLEQFDFLHHRGSSHGESRTIRATYPEPYYADMVLQSSLLWEEAQLEIGYTVYYKTRQLDVGPSDDKSLLAVIDNCRSNSIEFRVLDHSQVVEEFSGKVALPQNWVAVVTELGGVIKPTKAVSTFQTLALRNGAVLKDNMEVCAITRREEDNAAGGGVLACTANGEKFYGKKCVVTAGAWTKKLLEKVTAGFDIPIQPLEATVCYWRIKEGFEMDYSIQGGFPTFASYGKLYVYGTPSLEYPGLIKVALHGGWSCDPDKRRWSMSSEPALAQLREWIRETFVGRVESDVPVVTQSCMYSMTPDEDFVIDFLGGEFGKDVVVAGGFSGHGFKMGPVVGRVLADLVLDGVAGVDMKHFTFARFKDNPRGNVKEFGDQVLSHSNPT
ncbi:hypothetical protein Nepgr_012351 [Nepenthes gracilis]|uniref:FAD dependent oxidoreductase domain-containing protein n=1 Tax=Nepenthes gracilis TaxID=150966 RepID=A0AAD3SGS1_NEPGR|nr:hypothetical protein Nepgr_012351 [Nepenthes gracilis]